jgi:hypothetical protein
MTDRIKEIIQRLKLRPHPEGGYFKETYRSKGEIDKNSLGLEFSGKRSYSTCIYFLLTSEKFSAFHRLRQDEIWHFYDGSPISLHIISPSGKYSNHLIGMNLENGQVPQFVVPGGSWFAAEIPENNQYSLIGCTVSPGFDFEDFELKSRAELTSMFPDHENIISRLTYI